LEVQLRILDRQNKAEEIRRQILKIEVLHANDHIPKYASCLLCCILALAAMHYNDDRGIEFARRAVHLAEANGFTKLLLRAYHRKLFALTLRAKMDTTEGKETIELALAHASRGGDLRSKASIYNILAKSCIDVEDYGNAERFLGAAGLQASGPSERVVTHCNLGVLHYEKGEFPTAELHYTIARSQAERQPVFGSIIYFILAGLGLCALATGRLAAAQEFEEPVRRALETWTRDPRQLVWFLAELERRRGHVGNALKLIREHIRAEESLPLDWIKKKMLEVRYLRLVDREAANELMAEVKETASQVGLTHLVRS
jgi:hypothetical protein